MNRVARDTNVETSLVASPPVRLAVSWRPTDDRAPTPRSQTVVAVLPTAVDASSANEDTPPTSWLGAEWPRPRRSRLTYDSLAPPFPLS